MENIIACGTCGLVQRMEPPPPGKQLKCARCGFHLHRRKPDSRSRTLALSLAALILYVPANVFPIVRTQYWGMERETTIFDGIHRLFRTGSFAVGCLIFTTSILTPAAKILGLLALTITQEWKGWEKFRTWVFKIIQIVDPWNMLEVTMLAILVSIAELGKLATIHPGAGVFSFAAVVVLTICATLSYDPRLVWDPKKGHNQPTAGKAARL